MWPTYSLARDGGRVCKLIVCLYGWQAKILQEVAAETNKDEKDVAKYYKAFLERYTVRA